MSEWFRRLSFLFSRARFERELEEEMQHHLAESGDSRRFGNIALIKEDSRAMWTFTFQEQFAQDIRYGLRAMTANKLFTAMAALSLALGIGANTAIFSFLDAILLRTLPVRSPSELVVLNWSSPKRARVVHSLNGTMNRDSVRGATSPNFPFAFWESLRDSKETATSVFAYVANRQLNLLSGDRAEVVQGFSVAGNFFDGLGVVPAIGRLIDDSDDRFGAPPVAVITHAYWQSHFASSESVLGRSITVNNVAVTIVGVSAPGFRGIDSELHPVVFLPLHMFSMLQEHPAADQKRRFYDKNYYWLEIMARLRPGESLTQAQAVYGGLFHRFVLSTAATAEERQVLPALWAEDGAGGLDGLRREYTKPLYILMTMVGLILLIACANIANLLLARSTARRREIAIRLSLGAGRLRIVRQLLTESVMLSSLGGLLGLAVAWWGIRSITWLLSTGKEDFTLNAALNLPVLSFTFLLALVTGIVFGLAPALQATSRNVAPALKEARIGAERGRGRFSLSRLLVVSQIAVSLLLVVAGSLFVRTLVNLHSVNLGFSRENVLIFRLNARSAGYKDAGLARFYAGLTDRFRAVPGVRNASFSNFPLAARYWDGADLTLPDKPPTVGGKLPGFSPLRVEQGFLETMKMPVVLGRDFEARDMNSPRVAVVTEVFAKKYFPGESPVGHRIGIDNGTPDIEIVGVARASRYNSLKETDTPPVAYLPYTQDLSGLGQVFFELRTSSDPLALASTVRQIVHDASPVVPVAGVTTQDALIESTIEQERTFAGLCTCFAILALLIACVGLYGTMAYMVARRTSEIGIRVALGAGRRRIIWMVLREVMAVAGVGLAIGLLVAWQTAHFVASFLYGIKPDDPFAMLGSAAALITAALLAGYAPAWRASRIDPMVALRHE